ncbi:MAG: hypothetical protein JSU97_07085 [Dehalococcoidia bacterium]|nr:MAG: hypothetical protein JSU97_07085 [Dehalococcoidia bacterium]
MRRWLLLLAIVAGSILLGRRLAGRLREHMQSLPERMCSHMQQMMEKMPEEFP